MTTAGTSSASPATDPAGGRQLEMEKQILWRGTLAGAIGGPIPREASPAVAWGMAYSCLVVGVIGYALFFEVIRRFGASNAAALQLLSPPVAAISAGVRPASSLMAKRVWLCAGAVVKPAM